MKYYSMLTSALTIGLASYGAWRIFAVDVIFRFLRVRLFTEERLEKPFYGWLKYWLTCPWCCGAWIAALMTLWVDKGSDEGLPMPVLVFLAARAVVGWLGTKDEGYQEQMMQGAP